MIFFSGKKQHQHGERIIILINEMRYLLYYNDCHFACRFNSLPAEKVRRAQKARIKYSFSIPPRQHCSGGRGFLEVLAWLLLSRFLSSIRFRFLYLNRREDCWFALKRNRQSERTSEEKQQKKSHRVVDDSKSFFISPPLQSRSQVMYFCLGALGKKLFVNYARGVKFEQIRNQISCYVLSLSTSFRATLDKKSFEFWISAQRSLTKRLEIIQNVSCLYIIYFGSFVVARLCLWKYSDGEQEEKEDWDDEVGLVRGWCYGGWWWEMCGVGWRRVDESLKEGGVDDVGLSGS
jgi:hypothetical protein